MEIEMSNAAERVFLITGATDGLGRGVATELARAGATVLLHGRDASRLEATRAAIESTTNTNAQLPMQLGIFLEPLRVCEGSRGFLRTSWFGWVARKSLL
jgi:NAD(P)-dependent dehydrogenase (short-subunit alcohol dehydrogenase family)